MEEFQSCQEFWVSFSKELHIAETKDSYKNPAAGDPIREGLPMGR